MISVGMSANRWSIGAPCARSLGMAADDPVYVPPRTTTAILLNGKIESRGVPHSAITTAVSFICVALGHIEA